MNSTGAGKALPIILTALTLATALFFWKQRETLRQKTQELLDSNKQISLTLPTPTPLIPVVKPTNVNGYATPTITVTSSPIPTLTDSPKTTKKVVASLAARTTRTSTKTICTPVYGMANSCAEHTVVDTALDTTIFYNLAGISYVAGLAAFIKAKKHA